MPSFWLAIVAMRRARVNAIPEKRKKLKPSAIISVLPFVTTSVAKNEKLSKMASYIGFTTI
jgi:hypothetical protein